MKAVAALIVALTAAVSASPVLSERGDQCDAIVQECNAKQTECQAQHPYIECPVDVSRFCPCYHVAKECIKDAGCQ
ncbi:autophagy regulatory protein Atg2 [Purpureocillium lavendulum]|uniref:Autophagy regulatory protein Atg2 n=1 Tax=Purpureocillium lavendulum TaxID=1247861 RepID=A0AB34FEE6_9HYPO|nr:autophagy regulatory protein Atg2 [Purpureocillium lavendulum]